MTKKDEKKIVSIAEGEIEKFVEKWKKTPYAWESEADVHAELYGRICLALVRNRKKFSKQERNNYPFSQYGYKEWGKEKVDFKGVYCKPKVNGMGSTRYPDIVIYKKNIKPVSVDDKKNEPMLWVCEIKYATEWSGAGLPTEEIEKDIKKLNNLLEQRTSRTGTDYASYLILQRKRNKKPKNKLRYIKTYSPPDKKENRIGKILKNLNKKIRQHHHIICYE